jgi:hypothetical protein
MKQTTFLSIVTAALTLVVGGCGTTSTLLQVAGTPGAQFTAQYRAGAHSGSVTTITQAGGPATVLEMPGRGLTCDVSKKDPAAQLTVEIRQAGQVVYRAEAPAGTKGIRVWHTTRGWQRETY